MGFFLTIGLYWALKTGYQQACRLFGSEWQAVLGFAPLAVVLTTTTICFLWLYVA